MGGFWWRCVPRDSRRRKVFATLANPLACQMFLPPAPKELVVQVLAGQPPEPALAARRHVKGAVGARLRWKLLGICERQVHTKPPEVSCRVSSGQGHGAPWATIVAVFEGK